jgi:hypothetical protein
MRKLLVALVLLALASCASVDITKTAKGAYTPTNPNDVEILMTRPERPYVELGTVTVRSYQPDEIAKMHNAIRSKSAPLGANAVILRNQGIDNRGYLWAIGVAIRYKTEGTGN